MSLQKISSEDISTWDSLEDVAVSLEKRGLQPEPKLGEDNELVLRLTEDDDFMVLINAPPGESAASFKSRMNVNTHTGMVATDDFDEFTFITRIRSWDAHGRTKYRQLSFTKEQMTNETGEKNTILQKLNDIEFDKPETIFDNLYDTKQVVKAFYEDFEKLRTELVQEVAGIPDDRGDAKQRYVQVTLDRMIFLYFIQEKGLLDHRTEYLHEMHEEFAEEGNVYEEFYDPLFFEILAEGQNDMTYGNLPYLNGGLFSKNPIEEEFDDARLGETADETAELFGKILSFLSDWNWNVDERLDIVDPKNLSPAILGHIFEQTVNQKEMGAYYTPEEITGFMSRRTIHPWLLDQVNDAHGTAYEAIDDIFELDATAASGDDRSEAIADGGIAQTVDLDAVEQEHVKTLYFDALNELRILDPAVGSGAFLLAAQEVLLDVYIQCIEYFQALRSERPWDLHGDIEDELDVIDSSKGTKTLYGKKQIILNNLYGVDIDDGAVEICKLRLWLSMVADIENEPNEVEPLPNIDFNIRQGNSLIGITEKINVGQEGRTTIGDWGIHSKYDDVIKAVKKHRDATTSNEAANWRKIAEERISQHRSAFDSKIQAEFETADIDISDDELSDFGIFHWVLEFAEVWADGRFDVVIGNPPWDVLNPSRDDFFSNYDELFRTRTPNEKDEKQQELLDDSIIENEWNQYRDEMERRADYFTKGDTYTLQDPDVEGQPVATQNDLSQLFLERVFRLVSEDGYVSQIIPGQIFSGAPAKDIRMKMMNETSITALIGFENKGIFQGIHNQYQFVISVVKNQGETDRVHGVFQQRDLNILQDFESNVAKIPRRVLEQYSPRARLFPFVTSQREADVLNEILKHPPLYQQVDNSWYAEAHRELKLGYDADLLIESDSPKGDYPVYGGANFYQFAHDSQFIRDLDSPKFWSLNEDHPEDSAHYRIREKTFNKGELKKAIYKKFNGGDTSKSQKQFVNELLNDKRDKPLSLSDIKLDCTEYRIVFRDVARSTDERTLIASVIPKNIVCLDSVRTIRPYDIQISEEFLSENPMQSVYRRTFSDQELFAALGLLNSVPFDFLIRTKVETHVPKYKFEESQLPRLTDGDDWFQYISKRAAQLNCYGDEFAEMRQRLGGVDPATDENERERLQAEIDAASFHAYGLNRRDTEFVLDDFHRVSNPRRMTEEYFDLVFEKYDELGETGPHP